MTKVWHISDVHLSFLEDNSIKKDMSQRKWSIGCPAYQGYIERIRDFASKNICEEDVTFITGDIVHDMKADFVYDSLKWLRNNIPGILVICRGNHDKYWDIGNMRVICQKLQGFHLLDEGEMLSLGSFVIGCYSDHVTKTEDMEAVDLRYVNFAKNIIHQARIKRKTPVMISHYPVSYATAEQMQGLKAYLSGHIHCTSSSEGDEHGVNWKGYNASAKITDDKTINGCFFSTATTDVLLAKHNTIFKEIECLRTGSIDKKDINKFKSKAANAFHVDAKFATSFEKADPFNPQNTLAGFINRKKGNMQGSLYITHVNSEPVNPQLIFGTPKLEYPYIDESDSREYKELTGFKEFLVTEKWNGVNIMFYKYLDSTGKEFTTAKTKGTPFVSDSEVGEFLLLTKQAFKGQAKKNIEETLASAKGIQSITLELCGYSEPHLVKYSFDIDLIPLFVTYKHGAIKPIMLPGDSKFSSVSDDLIAMCKHYQHGDFIKNEMYRKERGLQLKYEYEHFAVEGKVLYLLDSNGFLVDRTMYKIKPKDIEEVHWLSFDKTMKARVVEAVKKVKMNEEKVSEDTMMDELNMGPKEWARFGALVMGYTTNGVDASQRVIVLVGLPASGKSTIAGILDRRDGWVRINQDELGDRKACKAQMEIALKGGKSVIIDRCNFDIEQRKIWIDIAHENGIAQVECVWLDVKKDVCHKRAVRRKDHPTIKNAADASKAIENLYKKFIEPTESEGFLYVKSFSRPQAANEIAREIVDGK